MTDWLLTNVFLAFGFLFLVSSFSTGRGQWMRASCTIAVLYSIVQNAIGLNTVKSVVLIIPTQATRILLYIILLRGGHRNTAT